MIGSFSNFLFNSVAGNSSKPSEEPLRKSIRRIGGDQAAFVKQPSAEGGVATNEIHDSSKVGRRGALLETRCCRSSAATLCLPHIVFVSIEDTSRRALRQHFGPSESWVDSLQYLWRHPPLRELLAYNLWLRLELIAPLLGFLWTHS